MTLNLRFRRPISRSEITQVDASHTTGLAIYATPRSPPQSWIDTFDLSLQPTKREFSKSAGSLGIFSPLISQTRMATLRDWTAQLGNGVEYVHATSLLIKDVFSGKPSVEIKGVVAGGPLAWSPDGKWVAAGEVGGIVASERVGIWDVVTGARIGRVLDHMDRVVSMVFTQTDELATISMDGVIRITNPVSGETRAKLDMDLRGSAHSKLSVSEDGRTIVAIVGTKVIVWDTHTSTVPTPYYSLDATRSVEGWPLSIAPNGRFLASRTKMGFDILDLQTRTILARESGGDVITAAGFSPDSKTLLLGRMDGVVEAWDLVGM